ncbi:MAG TPA: radical SAM protein, partial [Terriglobales bacterium]|nr:radical SAM protein [Terriglobales bacterium]
MLLIIQGTPFCNIDCSYCYLPNRDDRRRISLDLLHCLVDRLIEFIDTAPPKLRDHVLRPHPAAPQEINVVWHAGEPMTLPVSFYEAAFSAFVPLAARGITISHGFQTNGTLISDRWIEFILKSDVKIGVSIDGPRDLHDRHRRYRNGRGSFDPCLAGIQRLQAAAIPFHVITVLAEPSLHEPDRLFDFYCDHGLSNVGFNIEEIEGDNRTSSLAGNHVPALYRAFLRRFLQLNAAAGFPVRLREAEQMAALIIAGELPINDQT